ncbi:hypothetical protein K470DRAFT_269857 [Piedraia hortae CBS 480.64]|uniref:non-specific serine/threonine protein kinase n=1 Tax=Piedraia hortae CBS 480.64 TaxID=1314780 RepID=A0A6A7C226_9PEZI|nr:hypothetical protein K470DRAFT_269857 [Piedraia hortae CBS 480.64]
MPFSCTTIFKPHQRDPDAGDRVYRLRTRFAESGGGQALLATHIRSGRAVVIKTIPGLRDGRTPKEVLHRPLARLQQPPQALPKWNIVMECCTGDDLTDSILHWQQQSTHPLNAFAYHFVTEMASALGYLHHSILDITNPTAGRIRNYSPIIHRDIKPDNIFLR